LWISKLTETDSPPRDLVLVSGADTPARSTDCILSPRPLPGLIKGDVTRKDHRAGRADGQPFARPDASLFQGFQFSDKSVGRNDDSVSDQALNLWAKDSGRYEVQHRLFSVNYQGVARIVPALESHYCLATIGQEINNLSFSLITPLNPKDHYPF
jgi:hypothetical protein